jgi:hypothetical protein
MDRAEKTLKALQRAMLWNDTDKFEKNYMVSIRESITMADHQLAFATVVGSWNYNLHRIDSDVDLKAAYWPQFADFYTGRLPTVRSLNEEVDLSLVAFPDLFLNIVKCNWSFVEVLYPRKPEYQFRAEGTAEPLDFLELVMMARELVRGNPRQVVAANLGSAAQAQQRSTLYLSDKNEMKARKEQAKAYRFLYATELYLSYGRLDGWRDDWARGVHEEIMEGNIPFEEMDDKLHLVRADVKKREQKAFAELDRTCTARYTELSQAYSDHLCGMVKRNIKDL